MSTLAGCYLYHTGEEGLEDPPPRIQELEPALDPAVEAIEPVEPPQRCEVLPSDRCTTAFPRVMIVMDASSSMLAGEQPGESNWDKARLALAGDPMAPPGSAPPAFEREIEVRGQLVTMEDVFHLGMLAFNNETRLMLQYTPCASDNIRWAMDPYVSCEAPGCADPYLGMPEWTYKNSDLDRDPPFEQTTHSYVPPCNDGAAVRCIGSMFNTNTEAGLVAAAANITAYRADSGGYELAPGTPFALILITDGATSPGSEPVPVLEGLKERGIPTHVIGLEPHADTTQSIENARDELDSYARAGGTGTATLIEANEQDIADAFAGAVEQIIRSIGTAACCLPNDCSEDPEPPAP